MARDPGRRDGRPQCLRARPRTRLRPGAGAGVRIRDGDRADRDAQARDPRPTGVLRERCPLSGAVRLMRVPLDWLQEYCRPPLSTTELAERLTMTGTKVESIEHHGVGELDAFVVGRVLSAEK